MANTPLSLDITGERQQLPGSAAGVGGPSGMYWNQGVPFFNIEPAVVETVVTRVTRTTTSFAPIQLPRIPQPETLVAPSHLSSETYPLSGKPLPDDIKLFSMRLGKQRVVVQDQIDVEPSHAESSRTAEARGWNRTSPTFENASVQRISAIQGIEGNRSKEARKRPHQSSAPTPRASQPEHTPDPSPSNSMILEHRSTGHSPPRKRIRGPEDIRLPRDGSSALLSPLPSPEPESAALPSPESPTLSLGSGHEIAALYSLPSLVSHFDSLPDKLQQHVLMQLLKRSRMSTIQRVTEYATPALRRDFISTLPHELAVRVLQFVDAKSLTRATRVSKKWKLMIDTERSVWKQRLIDDDLYHGQGVEEEEEAMIARRYDILDEQANIRAMKGDTPEYDEEVSDGDAQMSDMGPSSSRRVPVSATSAPQAERPVPLKHVYRRRHTSNNNWFNKRPMHNSFPGHGTNVVTCLQFDRDKIVSASDDHSINIYRTTTGQLIKRLDGHEGGVWALAYLGDTLVSGSTDRTIRVWDMETMEQTHVFYGHASTVRCLQIVEPVLDAESGEYFPPYPLVVTGSRDFTVRVWKLPKKGEPPVRKWRHGDDGAVVEVPVMPEDNPYFSHSLEGHRQAIRAIAAYGRYCISGSYDHTVRVWDIVKGTSIWTLRGHDAKVYSIVYDRHRHRCASGSMDMTIKIWDLNNGECLHTLTGHTSLVGLLGLSPNFLVSAAADSSLRIWNSSTNHMNQILTNNGGAITCFQHDEHKLVSGSDGMLKLWDIRTGRFIRDLVIGINSVWQVAFSGDLLVAASNRAGHTVFDVFDFGELDHISGVDNERLDQFRRPPWERDNPLDPMAYQDDTKGRRRRPKARGSARWPGPSISTPTLGRGSATRQSGRLAQRPAIETSTSPSPIAGSSTNGNRTPRRSNGPSHNRNQHHHHHHHQHAAPGPSRSSARQGPLATYQGRITRSRSGPGITHSPSPARYSARTGSTGHLGRLALGNQDSYAPVFDDEEHPSPRLATRQLLSDELEEEDELQENGQTYRSYMPADEDDELLVDDDIDV